MKNKKMTVRKKTLIRKKKEMKKVCVQYDFKNAIMIRF